MDLSKSQLDFFGHHKIDLNLVFDAKGTGLVGKNLKEVMYNSDTIFAAGTNKCNNGHDIKTRSGHCPVCNTERIAHTLRNIKKDAYVYVVASKKGELIKIGFTGKLDDRLFHLNKDGYGGFSDWVFLYHAKYESAGEVELELHHRLQKYNYGQVYSHYGKEVRCYELFKCGYKIVKETIDSYNSNISNIKELFELKNAIELYNFSPVITTEKRKGVLKNEDKSINLSNTKDVESEAIEIKEKLEYGYLEKGIGEFLEKEDDYYSNMVFHSHIEINGVEYGIFVNDDSEYGIFRLDDGEIIGEKFEECGIITDVEGSYFLNVKKDGVWKILNVVNGEFLYGDFDYIYEIDITGFTKVKKDGVWKLLDLETGVFNDELFDEYFKALEIQGNKYFKVIDGIVNLSNGRYVGGTFDRTRNIQKIGDKHYFSVFKDISDEECLCGMVNIEKSELIGDWFDVLDTDIDEYLDEDIENDDMKINTHIINGEYCTKIYYKDKEGLLNLENGEIVSPMFDRIKDIKTFNGKTYLVVEENIETGIYCLEDSKFIGEMFSEVTDFIEIEGDIYIKVLETNMYGDFNGYIDLNREKLLGDFYEDIGEIQEKQGKLYFNYSYSDGSFGVYDIGSSIELKDTMLSDIGVSGGKSSNEKSNIESDINVKDIKTLGIGITSGFDNIGNTQTVKGKQYMPVKIGSREGIYCHTDKIIIGDLYDQLGYSKTPYGEYKDCEIRKYDKGHYFIAKKGWRYGVVNLKSGEFEDRGLIHNIMCALGI